MLNEVNLKKARRSVKAHGAKPSKSGQKQKLVNILYL